jgi:transcription-repair coupling factor (superfamily II helicase)
LFGLSGTAKATFIAALDGLVTVQGSLVFLVSGRDADAGIPADFKLFLSGFALAGIISYEFAPGTKRKAVIWKSERDEQQLYGLIRGEEKGIVFMTAEALLQKQARPQSVEAATLEVKAWADPGPTELFCRVWTI